MWDYLFCCHGKYSTAEVVSEVLTRVPKSIIGIMQGKSALKNLNVGKMCFFAFWDIVGNSRLGIIFFGFFYFCQSYLRNLSSSFGIGGPIPDYVMLEDLDIPSKYLDKTKQM